MMQCTKKIVPETFLTVFLKKQLYFKLIKQIKPM